MNAFVEALKTTPQLAIPRAYLIACCCEIENLSQEIVEKMISANNCPHIFEFIKNKQIIGELNFKWKNNCFTKFLKLFGSEFYNSIISQIEASEENSFTVNEIESSFATIATNRGLVAHENTPLSASIEDISNKYEKCMRALNLTKNHVESLNTDTPD